MSLPQEIRSASKRLNETNDCTVKAVAIATGISYERVHEAFKKVGRKDREGCSTWKVEIAMTNLGFKAEKLKEWKGKTAKTLDLPRKDNYIVFTCNHALAVKFGLVKDWTAERRHRITDVWKIVDKF